MKINTVLSVFALVFVGNILIIGIPVVIFAFGRTNAVISILPQQEELTLSDVSKERLQELVAVEDPGFYKHNGIDLNTPGAGYTTITQALVKFFYDKDGFTPGFLRLGKIQQSLYALLFNAGVSKDEQLTLFMNNVYLGSIDNADIRGFRNAARVYYQKKFQELTDDEYLSLVAMCIDPADYSVVTKPAENGGRVKRIKNLLAGNCVQKDFSDVYYPSCE